MPNWLAGFVTFGIMYAVFVAGIYIWDWPTMQHSRLYGTLEHKLPEKLSGSVLKVLPNTAPAELDGGSLFVVNERAYQLNDNSMTTTIAVVNGHLIVLMNDTPVDTANEIGQQYVGLVKAHVEKLAKTHQISLISVLFIPLFLFTLFAVGARWLWNKLLLLH